MDVNLGLEGRSDGLVHPLHARVLQAEHQVSQILVVDCDVHQGNGTAQIFNDDPTVFTLSIHGERNYPFRKAGSDLDVPLADGTGDADYLSTLEVVLNQALVASRPRFVFYVAGADPFVGDRLGRLKLTKAGLVERDRIERVSGGQSLSQMDVGAGMNRPGFRWGLLERVKHDVTFVIVNRASKAANGESIGHGA